MRHRFRLTDRWTVEMSWRLAAALAFGLVSGAVGAVQWAYAFGNRIVEQSAYQRDLKLQAYPTFLQLEQMIQGMDAKREQEYHDLRDRIEAVKELIQKR